MATYGCYPLHAPYKNTTMFQHTSLADIFMFKFETVYSVSNTTSLSAIIGSITLSEAQNIGVVRPYLSYLPFPRWWIHRAKDKQSQ